MVRPKWSIGDGVAAICLLDLLLQAPAAKRKKKRVKLIAMPLRMKTAGENKIKDGH